MHAGIKRYRDAVEYLTPGHRCIIQVSDDSTDPQVSIARGLAEIEAGDLVRFPSGARRRLAGIGATDLPFHAVCSPRFGTDRYQSLDSLGGHGVKTSEIRLAPVDSGRSAGCR